MYKNKILGWEEQIFFKEKEQSGEPNHARKGGSLWGVRLISNQKQNVLVCLGGRVHKYDDIFCVANRDTLRGSGGTQFFSRGATVKKCDEQEHF